MNSDALATLTLASIGLYGLVVLGGRSLLQRQRTGSAGWHGITAARGSLGWWAGVLLVVATLGLVVPPLLALRAPSTEVGIGRLVVGGVGLLAGTGLTLAAQLAMGDAWRIGVRPGERTLLRTMGLFGWCRNPVFTGMLLTVAAAAVWVPTMAVLWLVMAIALQLQVTVVEEPHLLSVHGSAYQEYAARTGRFVPWFGRGVADSRSGIEPSDGTDLDDDDRPATLDAC